MPLRARLAVPAIVVSLAGCESGPSGPSERPVVSLGVEITGSKTVAPGATTDLRFFAILSDGSRSDLTQSAEWTSDNMDVALPVAHGRIQGIKTGEATVFVNSRPYGATVEIIVVPSGTYRVTGRVTEADDPTTGIPHAFVRARDDTVGEVTTETDTSGFYRLFGAGPNPEITISRAGYADTTRRVQFSAHANLNLELTPIGARLQVAGDYAATFRWSDCDNQFEAELKQRLYSVTISQSGSRANLQFTHPTFASYRNKLANRMQGVVESLQLVVTSTEPAESFYGPFSAYTLIEELPGSGNLVIDSVAALSPTATGLAGTLQGQTDHYRQRVFVDSPFTCRAGSVTLDRRR